MFNKLRSAFCYNRALVHRSLLTLSRPFLLSASIAFVALLAGQASAGTITVGPLDAKTRVIADSVEVDGYTERQRATFVFALQQRINGETALSLSDDRAGSSRNAAWVLKAYCGELWQVARFADRLRLPDLSPLFDNASANCQDRVRGLASVTFRRREQAIVAKGAGVFARYGLVTADDFDKAIAEMTGRDQAAIQTIGNRMIEQSKSEARTSRPPARP